MEREVSLFRCSKLSCYSEFNRMVQAIARNGGDGGIPGTKLLKGTSTEYNFYATLVLMLKQVISNSDPVSQKHELQRVYEWFSLNKPLIKTKTKPSQRKPKVSITNSDKIDPTLSSLQQLDRPQTAPASFYKNDRCFSDDTSKHSRARRRNPSAPKSSRPTFTAMYISRSFCRDLDLIGQTFDQLQLREKRGSASREETRSQEILDAQKQNSKPEDYSLARESRESTISLIDFPSSDFPPRSNSCPTTQAGQRHGKTAAGPVNLATVFSMAPGIAAQMTLERELNEVYQNSRKRILSGQGSTHYSQQIMRTRHDLVPHHRLVTTPETPATETLKPMLYTESDSITTTTIAAESPKCEKTHDTNDDNEDSYHREQQMSPKTTHHDDSREFKEQIQTDCNSGISQPVTSHLGQCSLDTATQSSHLSTVPQEDLHQDNVTKTSPMPSEIQETLLDMKAVNSRQSILSQVSLKQKSTPRSREKLHGAHTMHDMSLHIEGQAVRMSSSESSGQKHRVVSAQEEHPSNSMPRVLPTRLAQEKKTAGSLDSLTIRPVSLQQHSKRSNVTPVKQDVVIDKDAEKSVQLEAEMIEDTTAVVPETQEKAQVDCTATSESHPVDSDKTQQLKDSSEKLEDNDNRASSSSRVDQNARAEHDPNVKPGLLNEENSNTVSAASKSDPGDDSSCVSQATPLDSTVDVPKSPIMVVREYSLETPLRPQSLRHSNSLQKSMSLRFPSPMNVVSLSFPTEDSIGHRRSRTEGFINSDAKKKTPTIIAGFNKKRYKRPKSSRAADPNQYKVS